MIGSGPMMGFNIIAFLGETVPISANSVNTYEIIRGGRLLKMKSVMKVWLFSKLRVVGEVELENQSIRYSNSLVCVHILLIA